MYSQEKCQTFSVEGYVPTVEAARRLGLSKPTVRSLIEQGRLTAIRVERGTRFGWSVEIVSLEALVAARLATGQRARVPSRMDRLEEKLDDLANAFGRFASTETRSPSDHHVVARERDDLRAEVSNLQEALARTRSANAQQREADDARAAAFQLLLQAIAANERADELRRIATTEMEEAMAGFSQPGHVGRLA